AVSKTRRLIGDFIFEVADSGGKTTVGGHVGIADKTKTQFEIEGFVKCLLLKYAGANDLPSDGGEHFVFARRQYIYLRNLRFLVKLFRAKVHRPPRRQATTATPRMG